MAEADEVGRASDGGVEVVGGDGIEIGVAEAAIHEHGRRQAGPVGDERRRLVARRGHDEPVDLAGEQGLEPVALTGFVLVRADEQDLVAVLGCEILQTVDEGGEEGIGEIRHDDAHGIGAHPAEAGGELVRPVADGGNGGGDAVP